MSTPLSRSDEGMSMQVDHDEERAVSVQVSESKWSTGNAIERSADLAAPAAPSSPVAVWPPSTLEEWRLVPPDIPSLPIGRARSLWNPLEAFFEGLGYSLFVLDERTSYQVPRNPTEIRAPDPYHVFVSGEPSPSRFSCPRNKLCAATRLSDGTHVVIQLLSINGDGMSEVDILRRLHLNPLATTYRNRCVPLLDLVTYEPARMVFGIFPLSFTGYQAPLHGRASEALRTCHQLLESIAYLHSNLVAHLDIGPYEFLLNVGEALDSPFIKERKGWTAILDDFYQRFDFQWSITDFNLSMMFDPDSDPDTRRVTGLCDGKLKIPHLTYEKMLGPEVWRDAIGAPYCPFKHDIYQISKLLKGWLPPLFAEFAELQSLFNEMASDNPDHRPAMPEVLDRFIAIEKSIDEDRRTQRLPFQQPVHHSEHIWALLPTGAHQTSSWAKTPQSQQWD
ncbi:hypothetical protein P389DRAFT_177180 [Cystobasidium minutum MCA 4210]|uniref:uncharacterized protein n=1 Tax=Cystobasidium minutum MCA 4210 TaxID=1397322 RepID=UPI0034CDB4EF|eukprot:jgi/Rhomi1/177180/fgenesh1_pg.1_\